MSENIEVRTEILKVSEQGIVYGIGFVCTVDGTPHYDLQDDYISVDEMFEATPDFMLKSRVMDSMHDRVQSGDVVFAMPMSKEVAEAYRFDSLPRDEEGRELECFMMAVKPHSDDELQKFRDGTYTGFSLDGMAVREPVE